MRRAAEAHTMSLRERMESDLRTALKSGDARRVSTLRLLRSAVRTEELDARKSALTDEEVVAVIAREVKRRTEAAAGFRAGGREADAAREEAERAILQGYLPAQLSDEELATAIREVIEESGARGPRAVGVVMGAVMKKVRGRADGARVRAIAERLLAS